MNGDDRLRRLSSLLLVAAVGCAATHDPLYGARPTPRPTSWRTYADPPRPQVVVVTEPYVAEPRQESPPAEPAPPPAEPPALPPDEPASADSPASDEPPAFATDDPVDDQRALNELAYEDDYLRQKERLFPDHAGQWLAIVAGRVLPVDARGRVAPAATFEECLCAADTVEPAPLHRFLFRIGEEGDVVYSDSFPGPRTMVGASFKQRFGITASFDARGPAIEWRRGDRSRRFAVEREQIEVRLSDPAGRAIVGTRLADSAAFGGFLALEETFAGLLDAEKHEIPGRALLRTGRGLIESRRARVRVTIPELALDELVPAAVFGG